MGEDWPKEATTLPWPRKHLPEITGSGIVTLQGLIEIFGCDLLYRACAESLGSDHASLIKELSRTFHQFRQQNIGDELVDVHSGCEALTKGPDGRNT